MYLWRHKSEKAASAFFLGFVNQSMGIKHQPVWLSIAKIGYEPLISACRNRVDELI